VYFNHCLNIGNVAVNVGCKIDSRQAVPVKKYSRLLEASKKLNMIVGRNRMSGKRSETLIRKILFFHEKNSSSYSAAAGAVWLKQERKPSP
jgi:hypothetical protein